MRKMIGLLAAGFLLSAPTMAAEGRTPIFEPTQILVEGHYYLSRDIVGSGGTPAIEIDAQLVDLDLNGFRVKQSGFAAFPAIKINTPPKTVRIHNGAVGGGPVGIESPFAGDQVIIEDVTVWAITGPSIHITNTARPVIRRVIIQGIAGGGTGILIDGGFGLRVATIESNVIEDVPGDGISFSNGSAGIINNRINAGGNGITLDFANGSLVSENTVAGAGATGILVRSSKGNKLFDNVVRDSKFHGIDIDAASNDNLVLNNACTNNGFGLPGGHGLLVEGDQNVAERNVLNSNSGFGLRYLAGADGNTFGRNTARGNAGAAPGPCGGAPGLFPPNSCNDGVGNSTYGDNLISPLF